MQKSAGGTHVTQRASIPSILIYWEGSGWASDIPREELQFAAWPDGKVMWREKRRDWVNIGGKWQYTEGRHFEGKVDPALVANAMKKIETSGAFAVKDWAYLVPDGSSTTLLIRSGRKKQEFSAWQDPSDHVPYRYDPVKWKKGVKAWNLIWTLTKSLTPAEGKEIKPPDVSKWQ